jgi:hypothetical protein
MLSLAAKNEEFLYWKLTSSNRVWQIQVSMGQKRVARVKAVSTRRRQLPRVQSGMNEEIFSSPLFLRGRYSGHPK